MPSLDGCKNNCQNKEGILCIHRFNLRTEVEYYNTKKLQVLTDLNVFLHFIANIINRIAEGKTDPDKCVFIILTRDRNFIEDVKRDLAEWEQTKRETYFNLKFGEDFILWDGLTVFIQQVDCPSYGHNRTDNLKCAFLKVNDF